MSAEATGGPVTAGYTAAILTGGSSRRMGRDKATAVLVDGQPLARRLADVLWSAGASEVLAIGGRLDELARLGLEARADRCPGDGPLGGIITALHEAARPVVVVVACDLVALDPPTVRALVHAMADPTVDVAIARAERIEPLVGAWRATTCRRPLEQAFAAGERAVHRVLTSLRSREVSVPARAVRNANTLDDLAHG
jgi:molybdopterin-guanine dinucleotide biosynthesis protein A